MADSTIRLVTLSYPPFCDETQADGGALVAITRAAFARRGIRLSLTVLPWPRLVNQLEQGRFDGVIGVWSTDLLTMHLQPSPPLFNSLIGVYQRSGDDAVPLDYRTLRGKRAGIVQGYNYSQAVLESGMQFDTARDDETNLRKLQLGRIDVAVVEKAVGDALLATRLLPSAKSVRWGGLVLAQEPLSVGFTAGKRQAYWHGQFVAGLQQLKQDGQYLRLVRAAGLQEYLPATAATGAQAAPAP